MVSVKDILHRLIRLWQRRRFTESLRKEERPLVDFPDLERRIGYRIRNHNLFIEALTHRSYLQFLNSKCKSNERLEFLGDSILNLIVGEYLYRLHPDAEEGELTKIRSRLVNRKALSQYAKEIGLSDFILMSSSAVQSVEKGCDSISVDAYESLIAAIYLDSDMDTARKFIQRKILAYVEKEAFGSVDDNYKSLLLEQSQANNWGIPRYNILKEEGPDHNRTFTIEVIVGGEQRGIGIGRNKKEAEQNAAREALEAMKSNEIEHVRSNDFSHSQ
jgi:ribonuclease-3